MRTTSSIINEIKGVLKRTNPSGDLKKILDLSNRPDVYNTKEMAIKSASNQAKTTQQTVQIMKFIESSKEFYIIAATNRDAFKLKQAGFVIVNNVLANGNVQ